MFTNIPRVTAIGRLEVQLIYENFNMYITVVLRVRPIEHTHTQDYATAYVRDKAGKELKMMYPNMVYLTCLVHCLHSVPETISFCYPDVDSFISNVKKIFLKSPSMIIKFFLYYVLSPTQIITKVERKFDFYVLYSLVPPCENKI